MNEHTQYLIDSECVTVTNFNEMERTSSYMSKSSSVFYEIIALVFVSTSYLIQHPHTQIWVIIFMFTFIGCITSIGL